MAAFNNNNTALINTYSQKITNDLANATDALKYTINKVVNGKKYYDIVIRIWPKSDTDWLLMLYLLHNLL